MSHCISAQVHANRSASVRWTIAGTTGLVFLAAVALANPAKAGTATVVGDSIGKELAHAIGLRTVARTSYSFRRHDIRSQLRRVKSGNIVLISAGLNDAADPVGHLKPSINRVITALTKAGHSAVWIGPPCVMKKWDAQARKLDTYLSKRLSGTSIQYASLRDPKLCSGKMRTRDGEHFTSKGYRYVWKLIRQRSSLAASVKASR